MWIDSTGKPNTNYNAAKPSFVGKPQPDGFGSFTSTFTYKSFQLSALFYYQYGFQVYNTTQLTNDGGNGLANQDKRALNRWQKPGDIAANPKRVLYNSSSYLPSTRELYTGDYIRLQTLSLNYNFPQKITSLLRLSMLKLYAQAFNLAIWTKYPSGDIANVNPVGSTGLNYPNQQSYSFGINLSF
jgi:hypothetical protein